MKKYTFIFLTCISLWKVDSTENVNNSFIPTKEWQTIKEGQSIPAGLHVRINLETGHKEAKLMDDDDSKRELSVLPDSEGSEYKSSDVAGESPSQISKELEDALKNIPGSSYEYSPEELLDIKEKYKSYAELKDAFKEMNMAIKTDSEIISNLIAKYKNFSKGSETEHQYIAILEDLNYLVHQIDNSLWFIKEGGLDLIILPMIVNQTDISFRTKSLRILGALTQNNPKAQIDVFERNFGYYLSQILITSSNSEELSTCLYAFGSLLRKFPHAQFQILPKYGIKALISVLNRDAELKIKTKAMTFISDLVVETDYALNMQLEPTNIDKMKQYKKVNIEEWLKTNNFCDIVIDFVVKSQNQLVVNTDLADYLAQSLQITKKICWEVWSASSTMRNTLWSIKERFEGTEEEYLVEIAQKLEKLSKDLYPEERQRDEL